MTHWLKREQFFAAGRTMQANFAGSRSLITPGRRTPGHRRKNSGDIYTTCHMPTTTTADKLLQNSTDASRTNKEKLDVMVRESTLKKKRKRGFRKLSFSISKQISSICWKQSPKELSFFNYSDQWESSQMCSARDAPFSNIFLIIHFS